MKEAKSEPDPPSAKEGTASLAGYEWDEWDAAPEAKRAEMVESVYPQLKRIAEQHMWRERHDHTLQPTALVNEFFLILARQRRFTVQGRAHFLAIASRAMRRLLIDYARHRGAERRGGAQLAVQLDSEDLAARDGVIDALALDEALNRLQAEDPRAAQVVELKYFGGLTFEEISHVIAIDERTAKRDWNFARARLFGYLNLEPGKHDED